MPMEAIEFTAKAKDGVIKIPKEFQASLNEEVRVIILIDSQKKAKSIKRELKAIKIKTKGFKFDRDEANRR
jgi:hypothetical protein